MSKSTSTIIKISAVCIAIVAIVAAFVLNSNDQKTVSTTNKDNTSQKQTTKTDNTPKTNDQAATSDNSAPQTVVAGSQSTTTVDTTIFGQYKSSNAKQNTVSTASTSAVNKPSATIPAGSTSTTSPAPATPPVTTPPVITPPVVTPPATTTNLIQNPSVEDSTNGLPNGWDQAFSDGIYTAAYEYANTGHTGSHSLKISVSSWTSGDAKWLTTAIPVTAGKTYNFSNFYQSTVASEVDVYDGTTGNFLAVLGTPAATSGLWMQFNGIYTAPTGVNSIIIGHAIGAVGTLSTDDYSLNDGTAVVTPPAGGGGSTTPTPPAPAPADCNAAGAIAPLAKASSAATTFDKARVTLTFDDGWKTIHDAGLPLLKGCGLLSTEFLNSQPIVSGFPDYMSYSDVKDFYTAGHELAWHTRTHADLTTLTPAQMDTELTPPSDFLTGLLNVGVPGITKDFATPYGAYSPDTASGTAPVIATEAQVSAAFTRNNIASHRSTDVGYNAKGNTNVMNIKVQNILDSTTPEEVEGWIRQANTDNSWLVIVYHEVKLDTNTATEDYSVTPAKLAIELSYLKQSGVSVETIQQALSELTPQL